MLLGSSMYEVQRKCAGPIYPVKDMGGDLRVAICFFGITRSLRFTIDSIRSNVIKPARSVGVVRIFAHFFDQKEIKNPRSDEFGRLDPQEYRLLNADVLALEDSQSPRVVNFLEQISPHGDRFKDGFCSLGNLAHQLHSIDSVTRLALNEDPDIIAFCRPDLRYHHSLYRYFRYLAREERDLALMPCWQRFYKGTYGENDRFGLVRGRNAAVAYGCRLQNAEDYCKVYGPLWSEGLMRYTMEVNQIPIKLISAKASRVRFDGSVFPERFDAYWVQDLKKLVRPYLQWGGVDKRIGGLIRKIRRIE